MDAIVLQVKPRANRYAEDDDEGNNESTANQGLDIVLLKSTVIVFFRLLFSHYPLVFVGFTLLICLQSSMSPIASFVTSSPSVFVSYGIAFTVLGFLALGLGDGIAIAKKEIQFLRNPALVKASSSFPSQQQRQFALPSRSSDPGSPKPPTSPSTSTIGTVPGQRVIVLPPVVVDGVQLQPATVVPVDLIDQTDVTFVDVCSHAMTTIPATVSLFFSSLVGILYYPITYLSQNQEIKYLYDGLSRYFIGSSEGVIPFHGVWWSSFVFGIIFPYILVAIVGSYSTSSFPGTSIIGALALLTCPFLSWNDVASYYSRFSYEEIEFNMLSLLHIRTSVLTKVGRSIFSGLITMIIFLQCITSWNYTSNRLVGIGYSNSTTNVYNTTVTTVEQVPVYGPNQTVVLSPMTVQTNQTVVNVLNTFTLLTPVTPILYPSSISSYLASNNVNLKAGLSDINVGKSTAYLFAISTVPYLLALFFGHSWTRSHEMPVNMPGSGPPPFPLFPKPLSSSGRALTSQQQPSYQPQMYQGVCGPIVYVFETSVALVVWFFSWIFEPLGLEVASVFYSCIALAVAIGSSRDYLNLALFQTLKSPGGSISVVQSLFSISPLSYACLVGACVGGALIVYLSLLSMQSIMKEGTGGGETEVPGSDKGSASPNGGSASPRSQPSTPVTPPPSQRTGSANESGRLGLAFGSAQILLSRSLLGGLALAWSLNPTSLSAYPDLTVFSPSIFANISMLANSNSFIWNNITLAWTDTNIYTPTSSAINGMNPVDTSVDSLYLYRGLIAASFACYVLISAGLLYLSVLWLRIFSGCAKLASESRKEGEDAGTGNPSDEFMMTNSLRRSKSTMLQAYSPRPSLPAVVLSRAELGTSSVRSGMYVGEGGEVGDVEEGIHGDGSESVGKSAGASRRASVADSVTSLSAVSVASESVENGNEKKGGEMSPISNVKPSSSKRRILVPLSSLKGAAVVSSSSTSVPKSNDTSTATSPTSLRGLVKVPSENAGGPATLAKRVSSSSSIRLVPLSSLNKQLMKQPVQDDKQQQTQPPSSVSLNRAKSLREPHSLPQENQTLNVAKNSGDAVMMMSPANSDL
jgi:hypothetical protein